MILVVVFYPDTKYIEAHQHEDKTSSEGFEMHLHADQIIQLIYLLSFVPFINLGLVRPRVRPSKTERQASAFILVLNS